MIVYKSKIGTGLVLIITLALGYITFLMVRDGIWLGLLITILIGIFCAYIFLQTYYVIDGKTLRVKCAFLVNQSFDIRQITKITETNNPIGAAAASLDRLEILLDNSESVIISPKQKNEFIDDLKKLNPNIIINLKT